MKQSVVIDTNIIFLALRGKGIRLRTLLDDPNCRFYAPNFLIAEIFRHKERILKHSAAEEDWVILFLTKMLQKISFVSEDAIGTGNMIAAFRLCSDIDENDTLFVALALELDCLLWTKDEVLRSGLKRKGFNQFFEPTL